MKTLILSFGGLIPTWDPEAWMIVPVTLAIMSNAPELPPAIPNNAPGPVAGNIKRSTASESGGGAGTMAVLAVTL
jgi:hypothetical protein